MNEREAHRAAIIKRIMNCLSEAEILLERLIANVDKYLMNKYNDLIIGPTNWLSTIDYVHNTIELTTVRSRKVRIKADGAIEYRR